MSLSNEEKAKLNEFALEESLWLDDLVRSIYPRLTRFTESLKDGNIKLALRFVLAKASGIRVDRAQDTETFLGGRGYRIRSVTSTVFRWGKEFEKKKFIVNAFIKNNP